MIYPTLTESLTAMGYTDLCEVAGQPCGLYRFMFTTGLMVGIDEHGYSRRYCYEDEQDAREALMMWDGRCHPGGPWIKVNGLGVDALNPEFK